MAAMWKCEGLLNSQYKLKMRDRVMRLWVKCVVSGWVLLGLLSESMNGQQQGWAPKVSLGEWYVGVGAFCLVASTYQIQCPTRHLVNRQRAATKQSGIRSCPDRASVV